MTTQPRRWKRFVCGSGQRYALWSRCDTIEFVQKPCQPCPGEIAVGERRRHAVQPPRVLETPEPVIGLSAGRRALFVDGVVQSVAPEDAAGGYWNAMIPEQAPASALLLGFGGGTVARLLHRRHGPLPITGVDESKAMLDLALRSFGPPLPDLALVEEDAFRFVSQTRERYGFIAVDLYRGNRLVPRVLALPFLRALAARLEPGGTVAYNLFRDGLLDERVARVERVFDCIRLVEVAANAIFHGRPHRRQR